MAEIVDGPDRNSFASDLTPEVDEIGLWRLVIPLLQHHAASYGSSAVRDLILISVTTSDGVVGWGECPTFGIDGYATETTDRAWVRIRDHLAPALIGSPVPPDVDGTSGPPEEESDGVADDDTSDVSAAAGSVADALLDNHLRRRGLGLLEMLGARRRPLRRTVVIAAVGAPDRDVLRRAEAAVRGGAAIVKIKVGPDHDHRLVASLVRVLGASRVAVDANGSFTSPEQLADLDGFGLAYIEQPFDRSHDWSVMGEMARGLRTPVALDESIRRPSDVEAMRRSGAGGIVSVKPARVGGLSRAARMVGVAHRSGLGVFVGGMVESGVGRAGALAIATLEGCSLPTDLGPSTQYFGRDVTEPLLAESDGTIIAPPGPGLGRTPIDSLLEELAVDRLSIAR